MTDVVEVCVMLLAYSVGAGVSVVFLRRLHNRCKVIASGVEDGIPVAAQYRWFVLLHDYIGIGFGTSLLYGGLGFGFFVAADALESRSMVMLGYYCGGTLAWGAVLNAIFVASWLVHLVRVLRADTSGRA